MEKKKKQGFLKGFFFKTEAQIKKEERGYRIVKAIDKPHSWDVPKTKRFNGLLYHLSEESHMTKGGALKELKKVREKGYSARAVKVILDKNSRFLRPWCLYIRKRK